MKRRRALVSSSAQPWWQNSSDSQRAAGSAPTAVCFVITYVEIRADSMLQNLVTSGNSRTTQQYTTIVITRTQYTTYIYSNSRSSQSQESTRSSLSSMSTGSQSSKLSRHTISTSPSWSPSFTYDPTTLSTTTTTSATTHSRKTVPTIIYVTSTHTIPSASTLPTTVPTSSFQATTSTVLTSATSATTSAVTGNGEKGHGSLLVSPDGSSRHAAAIAGGMTRSDLYHITRKTDLPQSLECHPRPKRYRPLSQQQERHGAQTGVPIWLRNDLNQIDFLSSITTLSIWISNIGIDLLFTKILVFAMTVRRCV
jgi:hypothetical protein